MNSYSLPLFGSLRVSLRSWISEGVSFSTSLILIPPLAISSRINRFLGFDVLKITSSTVSFSIMFQGNLDLETSPTILISLIALMFSLVSIAWSIHIGRRRMNATGLASLSHVMNIEQTLGQTPTALKFHGITPKEMREADIEPKGVGISFV